MQHLEKSSATHHEADSLETDIKIKQRIKIKTLLENTSQKHGSMVDCK